MSHGLIGLNLVFTGLNPVLIRLNPNFSVDWVESWTSWVEFAGLNPGLIRLNPKNSKSITGLLGLNQRLIG